MWRLIVTKSLWKWVIIHRYIEPLFAENLIHMPNKSFQNMYVIWRATFLYFDLVEFWLAWWICNAEWFCIGLDPCPGC